MMDMVMKGMLRLIERYAICDLEEDTYKFYSNSKQVLPYAEEGSYRDLVDSLETEFKIFAKNLPIGQAFSSECLRSMLQTSEDVYRVEYCTLDEQQFRIAAFTPLEWKEDKVATVLLMVQDNTQEKQMEIESRKALKTAFDAANQANRAKTDFLSNMSHDIRTPMNAIVGMTAIAGANIGNQEKVLDCLGKITQSSRHLLGLINEVLDMSRIESGKIALAEEEFSLSGMVDNLAALLRNSVEAHQHDFEIYLNQIVHEDVIGDSLRLQQLIANILSNSIKYTPDGGRIRFSITELPASSTKIARYQFVIEDNGVGMSKEFQEIMFEPFTREDGKQNEKIQGTGLGMAIARNLANMMNGSINVESEPGKGSRFEITILLKIQEKEERKIEELVRFPVLVVDDDLTCCKNTVEILKEIGIDGEWVTSGESAVARTMERGKEGKHYFAIVIDWLMPGMNGIETARQIRKIVGNDVTIIILSAFDFSEIEAEARAAGVDGFITKPLFRSRLMAALKNILDGRTEQTTRKFLTNVSDCDFVGKRILLVEDNELNCEIAGEIISMAGVEVVSAKNGKEAVENFADKPDGYYDLIFMDIQMPVLGGYEATDIIRAMDREDAKKIPIIAMTANAFAEDRENALSAGMNDHIAKPIDTNLLIALLQKYL